MARPGHLNSYEARIFDERGDTIDSLAIDAVNLRVALERACRLIASRDSGHGQKAVAFKIERSSVGALNAPRDPQREEMDTL